MSRRYFTAIGVMAVVIAFVFVAPVTVAGQAASAAAKPAATRAYTPPRTVDGKPDLQGVWNFATITPLEVPDALKGKQVLTDEEVAAAETEAANGRIDRAPRQGDTGTYNQFWFDRGTKVVGNRRSSLIVDPPDGKLPSYTPEGAKAQAANVAARQRTLGPEDRNLGERCILGFNAGPPMLSSAYNNLIRIYQSPTYVAIVNEMINSARIIPTDVRPHGTIPQWMGDARGRWDGNTLVIESRNFTSQGTGFLNARLLTDQNLRLVERFTRVDADTINYEFTIDDPTIWTRPWSASMPMVKTNEKMYEYACHEGNYGMFGILSGARADEAKAAAAKK